MCRSLRLFVAVVIVAVSFNIGCHASVKVDGFATNSEWESYSLYSFETPDGFNNSVKRAYLRAYPDFTENKLYLCVVSSLDSFNDNTVSGVTLSFIADEGIVLHGNGESEYNNDKYEIDFDTNYDQYSKNLTYEICVGFKYGVPKSTDLKIRITDFHGNPSNVFAFKLDFTNVAPSETSVDRIDDETQKIKYSKTKKPSKTTTTNVFTFKTAETVTHDTQALGSVTVSTQIIDLNENAVDKAQIKGRAYAACGILGAFAIVTGAIYRVIRKNKQSD